MRDAAVLVCVAQRINRRESILTPTAVFRPCNLPGVHYQLLILSVYVPAQQLYRYVHVLLFSLLHSLYLDGRRGANRLGDADGRR